MTYALTGFFQDGAFRVFTFQGVSENRRKDDYWVRADLALVRKYNIQIQELPLLCRAILENRAEEDGQHTLTYTAADMETRARARAVLAQSAKVRKPHRGFAAKQQRAAAQP